MMKLPFPHIRNLPPLALAFALISCQTTGDPAAGGLFGYSPSKFRQEQDAREAYAASVDDDTNHKNRQARRLANQIEEKKRSY